MTPIKNNNSYAELFIKQWSISYTSKTYGFSAIECYINKILRIYPICFPLSETILPKVHYDINKPFI